MQKRHGGDGITIVTGGEAGTAEGDFASCLVWSSRPGNELPILMVVTNNGWGIATPACSQHGEKQITDRGKGFGIDGEVVDGNDPIASWHAIARATEHCAATRRPFMIEATVSRLYGHSSSSGRRAFLTSPIRSAVFEQQTAEGGRHRAGHTGADPRGGSGGGRGGGGPGAGEPMPTPADVEKYTYAPSPVDAVYPGDYTGLP